MPDNIAEIADSGVSEGQLKALVERIESVSEEIDALTADRKEIFAEAKAVGFDRKILAAVIRRRKLERAERQEMDSLLELYESALEKAAA